MLTWGYLLMFGTELRKAPHGDHWTKVRQTWANADSVKGRTVFNIKGNSYRLIVGINYESQTIFIKDVLTHAEYNRGDWK